MFSQPYSFDSPCSLTYSQDSGESDSVKTPSSSRTTSEFSFEDSPTRETEFSSVFSSKASPPLVDPSDQEESLAQQTLRDLNLNTPSIPALEFFESPTKAVKQASVSQWASGLSTPTSPNSPENDNSNKRLSYKLNKRPGLKMDLSGMQNFDYQQQINAPLIGCLPTPSPTTTVFGLNQLHTPRPMLTSRFSDDSPLQAQESLRASSSSLAPPASPTPHQPMTPRTVDALNCFGICSNPTSQLMSRGKSRDKPSSPTSSRGSNLPRSPLSMPPSSGFPSESRLPGASARSLGQKEARSLFHNLLPGCKKQFAELLQTPDDSEQPSSYSNWTDEPQYAFVRDVSQQGKNFNPYFQGAQNRS